MYTSINISVKKWLVNGGWIVRIILQTPYVSPSYQASKRILDICGALVGLAFLIILLPVLAFLIYREDRGPIFYKQERLGLHGHTFTIYKLRSMVMHADHYLQCTPTLQHSWRQNGKLINDPRVTYIGKFLRRSSLDELPQMLNVLRGEMSLVGPRAIQPAELAAMGKLGKLRMQVKPGLTGLWQISGRSNTSYEQRSVLDCIYVFECSFKSDLSILLRTFPVVIRGIGTY